MGISLLFYYLVYFASGLVYWTVSGGDIVLNVVFSGLISFGSLIASVWVLDILSSTFREHGLRNTTAVYGVRGLVFIGAVFGFLGSSISIFMIVVHVPVEILILFLSFWPLLLVILIKLKVRKIKRERRMD